MSDSLGRRRERSRKEDYDQVRTPEQLFQPAPKFCRKTPLHARHLIRDDFYQPGARYQALASRTRIDCGRVGPCGRVRAAGRDAFQSFGRLLSLDRRRTSMCSAPSLLPDALARRLRHHPRHHPLGIGQFHPFDGLREMQANVVALSFPWRRAALSLANADGGSSGVIKEKVQLWPRVVQHHLCRTVARHNNDVATPLDIFFL